jgi:hypothetical protein
MFDRLPTRRRTLGRADPCGSRDRGRLDRGFGSEHLGNVPRTAIFELADGSEHRGDGVAFDLVLDNAKMLEPGSLKCFGRRKERGRGPPKPSLRQVRTTVAADVEE